MKATRKTLQTAMLVVIMAICCQLAAAQTTGLYAYNGGYFIKDGTNWTEYRPKDREGSWSTYKQYREDDNFFYMKSSACEVCVPKETKNSFYIRRDGEWKAIYTTVDIYPYFSDTGRQIYCYKGGYFVRDVDKWREYRPADRKSLWAEYTTYDEEESFYNIKNDQCLVSIPKKADSNFFIRRDNQWKVVYYTQAIYDIAAEYDFTLYFDRYKQVGSDGRYKPETKALAMLCVDRKGNGLIRLPGEDLKFTFKSCSPTVLRGTDQELGIRFNHDDDNIAYVTLGQHAHIFMKRFFPSVSLLGCRNKYTYTTIRKIMEKRSFFKQ